MKTQTLLVIEDDPGLLEILVLTIKSRFHVDVLEANSLKKALEIIDSSPKIACIFSDYDLGDGNSYEVYLRLKTLNLDIPFILCSAYDIGDTNFTEKDIVRAAIKKPFKANQVIEAISGAIGPPQAAMLELTTSKYCPIRLSTLLKMGGLNCDLYIELSSQKYVKLARTGDVFGQNDFDRFVKKNIQHLFVNSNDMGKFLDNYTHDLIHISQAKALDVADILRISTRAHEVLHSVVSLFGLDKQSVTLAETCTRFSIASIKKEPTLVPYIERLNFDRESYLSTHSMLLAHVSGLIASMFGWTSETTQYKLAFAAIIHDLALKDNSEALNELTLVSSKGSSVAKLGERSEPFKKHGHTTNELLKKMKNVPSGVDLILKSHHERPDGSGFPDQLNTAQLGPLPSLFIIAHDLTNHIWLEGQKVNVKSFITKYKAEYNSGIFSKFITLYQASVEDVVDHLLA